jgi:NodT family efflux transporter outer membrane factor (OMF) lipoprotein
MTLMLVALATGCSVGPKYQRPKVTVLSDWGEQGREPSTTRPTDIATTQPASRTLSGAPPAVQWWTTFRDPELDTLIERALEDNPDLGRATARVREARAERKVVHADDFPQVNLGGSYTHVRASENGIASAFGSSSGGGAGGDAGVAPPVNVGGGGANAPGAAGTAVIPGSSFGEFDLYQLGFDASWELDIFGGRRHATDAARAREQSAVEDRRDVVLTLMAEVAREYIDLRSTQRRLAIARENLEAQTRTLDLTRQLNQRGLTSRLDETRAMSQVASTRATIPAIEASASRSIHRLGVLLGERPTALATELTQAKPIPPVPDDVPVGLPSELLRRRPDIRRAERQLAASTEDVGVATAELFPRFFLNGSVGLQGTDPGNVFEYASRYYSLGPSVSWPLFDAGRSKARLSRAEARRAQSFAAFRGAVLNAFREVEDSLVSYAKVQERAVSLREAAAASRQSVKIANELYSQGVSDFLSVLDAQRQLLFAEEQLANAEGERATSLVALYKALGGGWELDEVMRNRNNLNDDQNGSGATAVVSQGPMAEH